VDSANNVKVLHTSGISFQNLVDIQKQYKIIDNEKKLESLADLVTAIIEPFYAGMNDDIKNMHVWHLVRDDRLDTYHLTYAPNDAYTSYDMYRRIVDMGVCLLPLAAEGSL
jgi:hypothetical protein